MSTVSSPLKPFLTVYANVSPSPSTVLPEKVPRMSNSSNVASRALFSPLSSASSKRHCSSVRLYTLISSALTCRGGSDVSFNATAISSLRVWMVVDGATRRTSVVL